MKMKLLCLRAITIGVIGALTSGCADNIGSYSSSTVAPVDRVVYYVAGTVSAPDGSTVSGATVVSGDVTTQTDSVGNYQLTLTKGGTHTVMFGGTGYVTMSAAVSIPSNAGPYSEVPLNAIIYPTALTTVTPSQLDTTFVVAAPTGTQAEAGEVPDVDVAEGESAVSLSIPPGAVSKQLTVSYFAPSVAVTNATAGGVELPLAAVNVSPDVASFNDNARVTMSASNPLGSAAFAIMSLYDLNTGDSVAASYSATDLAYTAQVSHFSSWLFAVPAQVTFAAGDSVRNVDVDNSGNDVSLRGEAVTLVTQRGWKLLSCSDATLTTALTALMTRYKGCSPGVTQNKRTSKVNVSAGSVLRVTCTQNFRTEAYVFTLADGTKVTATVLQYLDMTTGYLYVGHSGGSGE